MSCVAQPPTFRLLDSLVGWDVASAQGIGGFGDDAGISLERLANPWTNSDISRALPPAHLARTCACEWYLVTPCPPPSSLLFLGRCDQSWRSLWGCHCPPITLQCGVAVAVDCSEVAIADSHAQRIWLLGDGGRILKASIPLVSPGPLTSTPWRSWLVVDRGRGALRGFDRGGREISAPFAPLPGLVDRLGFDSRCRLWLITAEEGRYKIWWTERSAAEWTESALSDLQQAFPDTGLSQVAENYFCFSDDAGCFSWYGRPASPLPPLPPAPPVFAAQGQLLTLALDSGIPRCAWHRVRLDAEVPAECTLTVAVSTHDEAAPPAQGNETDPQWQAFEHGLPHPSDWQTGTSGARDFLISQPLGRYLFVRVRMTGNGYASPLLHRVRLDFPRQSSADRLPAVYREVPEAEDFLHRFLSLFDTAIGGIDDAIERSPALLDSQGAPAEMLPWLGSFFDVVMESAWTPERRRQVLKAVPDLYRRRGTVGGLRDTIRLLHDVNPVIEESAAERMWGAVGSAALGQVRLFNPEQTRFRVGRSPLGMAPIHSFGDPNLDPVTRQAFRFRVFLPGVISEQERARIAALIESQKPAHTVASVSGSRRGFLVGPASRVGVDTVLVSLEAPVLGRNSRLNRTAILWHGGCHDPSLAAGGHAAVAVNTLLE